MQPRRAPCSRRAGSTRSLNLRRTQRKRSSNISAESAPRSMNDGHVSTSVNSAGRKATRNNLVGTRTPSRLHKGDHLRPHSPFPTQERTRGSQLPAPREEEVGGVEGDHLGGGLTAAAASKEAPANPSHQPRGPGRDTGPTGFALVTPQRVPHLA